MHRVGSRLPALHVPTYAPRRLAMHHRVRLLVWLILCAVTPAPYAFPEDTKKAPASALAGVEALDQPVTCSETKIALGDLVGRVAADTGVKLTTAREVTDEPVAVAVKAMPARELLEQLADLLDYRWSRRG